MALHSLYCADVLLRNCSFTHSGDFVTYKMIILFEFLSELDDLLT